MTALNGLITSIQSLTSYDPTTQTAGPLLGNATLQSFQNQLSNILDQVKSGNAGAATSLASLGITVEHPGYVQHQRRHPGQCADGESGGGG